MRKWMIACAFVFVVALGLAATDTSVECANCDSQLFAWLAINDAEYSYCQTSAETAFSLGQISVVTFGFMSVACNSQKDNHDQDAYNWWWNCTP